MVLVVRVCVRVCACACVLVYLVVCVGCVWRGGVFLGRLEVCLCAGKGEFAAACLACILLFASVLSCWRVEEGHLVGWCGVYGPELDWTTVQEVHVLMGCVGSAGSWPMGRTGTDRIGPRCGCSWYFPTTLGFCTC